MEEFREFPNVSEHAVRQRLLSAKEMAAESCDRQPPEFAHNEPHREEPRGITA
jgi:hypothetical protein